VSSLMAVVTHYSSLTKMAAKVTKRGQGSGKE
jgi:hypothetical protein